MHNSQRVAARPPVASRTRSLVRAGPRRVADLPLPAAILAGGRQSIVFRWLLSRGLTLTLMSFAHEGDASGDVTYYGHSLDPLFNGASTHYVLQEYPVPVLALMAPQYLLGFENMAAFTILFAVSMLAVDAIFTGFLWRGDGRRRGDATNLWLWFVPMIGPLAYFRFDLVPAVLAGGAVLVAARRPAIAGALTALGAAIKLWPAVMLPTFLIRRQDRRGVLVGFFSTAILVGAICLQVAGIDRNLSPLHWQSARGLQIESVPATPLMALRVFRHHTWELAISQYKSWEIFGPAVPGMLTVSTVVTILGGLVLVALWWRAHQAGGVTAETLGWLFISTTLIVTVTNKALSPQYLLWLGGPVAALAVRAPQNRQVRRFGRIVLVAALATQLTYPIGYAQLTMLRAQMPVWTTVLVVRNLLLLWLTCAAVRRVWIQTARRRATDVELVS